MVLRRHKLLAQQRWLLVKFSDRSGRVFTLKNRNQLSIIMPFCVLHICFPLYKVTLECNLSNLLPHFSVSGLVNPFASKVLSEYFSFLSNNCTNILPILHLRLFYNIRCLGKQFWKSSPGFNVKDSPASVSCTFSSALLVGFSKVLPSIKLRKRRWQSSSQ